MPMSIKLPHRLNTLKFDACGNTPQTFHSFSLQYVISKNGMKYFLYNKGQIMKLLTIAASTILVLGLSTTAYAAMGEKCGGGGMNKQSSKCGGGAGMLNSNMPFKNKKAMCLSKLDTMKKCVDTASTTDELQACKANMMKGNKKMMGQGKKKQSMKCGAGKCGGK